MWSRCGDGGRLKCSTRRHIHSIAHAQQVLFDFFFSSSYSVHENNWSIPATFIWGVYTFAPFICVRHHTVIAVLWFHNCVENTNTAQVRAIFAGKAIVFNQTATKHKRTLIHLIHSAALSSERERERETDRLPRIPLFICIYVAVADNTAGMFGYLVCIVHNAYTLHTHHSPHHPTLYEHNMCGMNYGFLSEKQNRLKWWWWRRRWKCCWRRHKDWITCGGWQQMKGVKRQQRSKRPSDTHTRTLESRMRRKKKVNERLGESVWRRVKERRESSFWWKSWPGDYVYCHNRI